MPEETVTTAAAPPPTDPPPAVPAEAAPTIPAAPAAAAVIAADAESDEARSLRLYQSSQTFLGRTPHPTVLLVRIFTVGSLLALFFVVIPLLTASGAVADYKLNILGKYLCFAIAALGIDLIWGYTGLLSLCQALFFCLGGYAMAMHLSLQSGGGDVRPEYNNIPQFMFFNNLHDLPGFWKPFSSFSFSIFAALALPTLAAALFGFFILRNRVRGVYFSIITQALAQAAWLLISRNEMLLGGTNGLTNYNKSLTQSRDWIIGLYLLTTTTLVLAYLFCRFLVKSRLGRILVAVRDKETRLYFAGYKPHLFKVFAFAVGALLAGIGGMLYPAQASIITPQNMDVSASIVMVVGVAMGGRGKLWGAIFGALLLNVAGSSLSSDLAAGWLYVLGGMAVGVVLFFPDGFAGLWDKMERQIAGGEGFRRAALTALPIVVAALFVLGESLGLTPRFLSVAPPVAMGVPLKYVLIVVALVMAAAFEWADRRNRARRARGFAVGMPAAGVAVAGGV